jgi:hypothetical protein
MTATSFELWQCKNPKPTLGNKRTVSVSTLLYEATLLIMVLNSLRVVLAQCDLHALSSHAKMKAW